MRRAAALLAGLLLLGARAARADDAAEPERAFVETLAARATPYVGEPTALRLRVGFDRDWFRDHAVPLFLQAMDVPVQVDAPWLEGLAGAALRPDAPLDFGQPRPRLRFAANGGAVTAVRLLDRERGGRVFTVLEVERTFLFAAPGEVAVPAPTLHFAHATRFEDDALGGRVPVDRRDTVVVGAPLALRVLAWPEEGRPPEFVDAVGRFTVRAEADRVAVERGAIFRLTLRLEGDGNLEALTPPRLDRLPGFHVYGALDDRALGRRTVAYDLAATDDGAREVPPIAFASFDPGPPSGYRVVRTERIPLEVRPGPPGPSLLEVTVRPDDGGFLGGPLGRVLLPAVLLAIALAIAVMPRRRRAPAAPIDAHAERARAASAALRAAAARPDGDLSAAFAELLAAHLRRPTAAVVAADLAARLVAAATPPDLAARAAATLDGLVSARYGGGSPAIGADAVLAVADDLEAAWRRAP